MADEKKPDEKTVEMVECATVVHVVRPDKATGKKKLVVHRAGTKLAASEFTDVQRTELVAHGALRTLA